MKWLTLLIALFSVVSLASTPVSKVPSAGFEHYLNNQHGLTAHENYLGTVLRQAHNTAVGVWDFDQQGATTGNVDIGIHLPDNAIIVDGMFDTITQPTSAVSAEIGFTANSAYDLITSTAIASWTVGLKDMTPDSTAANAIKLTDARTVYAVVSGTPTAGKIKVFIDYVLSE